MPSALPAPRQPGETRIHWATRHREIPRDPVSDVLRVIRSDAWARVVIPASRIVDRTRRERYGPGQKSAFRLDQFLGIYILHVARADINLDATLEWLTSHHAREIRIALRLALPHEQRADRRAGREDGIPDRATVYRYLKNWLPDHVCLELLRRIDRELLAPLVTNPYFRDGNRLLMIDGSKLEIERTAPIVDPKTRRVVNFDLITAPDAGYLAHSARLRKTGPGYALLLLHTADWLVLAAHVVPIHASEKRGARACLDIYEAEILPLIGDDLIGILSADANFVDPHLRRRCRSLGLLDNFNKLIKATSDVELDDDESEIDADEFDEDTDDDPGAADDHWPLPLDGYPDWFVTRHRDLVCRCGLGTTGRRYPRLHDGRISPRLEATCANCGSASITAGDWRYARNPSRFTRCAPGEPGDLLLGNGLTRPDPLAYQYSKSRFALGEGLFGAFSNQYRVLRPGPQRIRSRVALEARLAAIIALHHAAAGEWLQTRHERE